MKPVFTFLTIFLLFFSAAAQSSFEGMIIYRIRPAKENNGKIELVALFGKNAIRLKFKENDFFDKEELLIRLDSGKVYKLNTRQKIYSQYLLEEWSPQDLNLSDKVIAGYKTRPELQTSNGIVRALQGYYGSVGQLVTYPAAELRFAIPDKYNNNPELLMVDNNRIVLGLSVYRPGNSQEENEVAGEQQKELLVVEASEITTMAIPEADFFVPPGFILNDLQAMNLDDYPVITVDTATRPAAPKKPAGPARKKAPSTPNKKGNATSPARKPD